MRALAVVCCISPLLTAPTLAEDCDADRYAAAQAIAKEQAKLEIELGPYEAAVMSGDLLAFDRAAVWVVGPWEDLMAAISRERTRLTAIPCPLHGIPDENRLPFGWDTVRDIGIRHVVQVDRAITVLNAQARGHQMVRPKPR